MAQTIGANLTNAEAAYNRRPYVYAKITDEELTIDSNVTGATGSTGNPSYVDTCVGADGSMITAAGNAGGVYIRRITDPSVSAQWTTWTNITTDSLGTPADGEYQLISITADGANIYLYYWAASGNIKLMESTDNGQTWGAASTVKATVYPQSIAAYKKNVLVYKYESGGGGGVYYSRIKVLYWNGSSWTTYGDVPGRKNYYMDVGYAVYPHALDVTKVGNKYYIYSYETTSDYRGAIKRIWFDGTSQFGMWESIYEDAKTIPSAIADGEFYVCGLKIDYVDSKYWLVIERRGYSSSGDILLYESSDGIYFKDVYYVKRSYSTDSDKYWTIHGNMAIFGDYYYLIGEARSGSYPMKYVKFSKYTSGSTTRNCDITDDILDYNVSKNINSTATLSLTLNNAGGKYMGASPSKTGYQALKRNAKITLKEGYYYSGSSHDEVTEGVYYIDDIHLESKPGAKTIKISCRDAIKNLKNYKTLDSLSYLTPIMEYENFAGDTITPGDNYQKKWEVSVGTWSVSSGNAVSTHSGASEDNILIYKNRKLTNYFLQVKAKGSDLANGTCNIRFRRTINSGQYQYALVMKSTGFDFNEDTAGWTTLASHAVGLSNNTWYWMRIIAYYDRFYCYYSTDGITWTQLFSGPVTDDSKSIGDVGLAVGGTQTGYFDEFILAELNDYTDAEEIIKLVGNKAGITSYDFATDFEDSFAALTNWNTGGATGDWSVASSILSGYANGVASAQILSNNALPMANAIIKCTINGNDATGTSVSILYRATDASNFYELKIDFANSVVKLSKWVSGSATLLATSPLLDPNLQTNYEVKIAIFGNWHFFYIDRACLMGFYDTTYTSAGKIGFRVDGTGKHVDISNLKCLALKIPIDLTANYGTEGETVVRNVLNAQKGMYYVKYDGSLKVFVRNENLTSVKTIQNQIMSDNYLQSDKEKIDISRATGDMRDPTAFYEYGTFQGIPRYMITDDNKIKNKEDAKKLAEYNYKESQKFCNQPDISTWDQVELELYDVITIVDSVANIDGTYKYQIYNLTKSFDAKSAKLEMQIGVGRYITG